MFTFRKIKLANLLFAPLVFALMLVVYPIFSANAAEIGNANRVKNVVTGSKGNRRLSMRDPVFTGETIKARSKSHGELLLKDKTKIVVGENSSVSLDNFAVSSGGIKKGTFKLTKGALRLITGNSVKKNTYKVKTRNATIGARGTGFDVYIRRNGETDVVLIDGQVDVCSSSGCRVVKANCGIVRVKNSGSIETRENLRAKGTNRASEDANYNLFAKQGGFASGWRLPTIGCHAKRLVPLQRLERIRRDLKSDPVPTSNDPAPQIPTVETPDSGCSSFASDEAGTASDDVYTEECT